MSSNECETDLTLGDAPMEILIKIFEYLNPSDLYMVNCVCHHWFNAAQHSKFTSKLELRFEKLQLCDTQEPLNRFLVTHDNLCQRQYPNVVLDAIQAGSMPAFWLKYGKDVKELTMRYCDISEPSFIEILKELKTLKTLNIINCRYLFMVGQLLANDEYQTLIKDSCENITTLNLTDNRYLSDAIFNRFVNLMPNLTSLEVSVCNIAFHHGLCHRFYPTPEFQASENVLTFNFISHFIKTRAEKLKTLKFNVTAFDDKALMSLSTIQDLELTTLILRSCGQLTNSGIISFANTKLNELTYLDFSMLHRLTDNPLIEICNHLTNLQVLKLRRCSELTDLGICEIVKLKKLQILDLTECDSTSGEGLIDGIASEQNLNLIELHLSHLFINEEAVIKVAESFPNLRFLDLSYGAQAVTNLAVQAIFKNLTLLRTLNLSFCAEITDAGLTGVSLIDVIKKYDALHPKYGNPAEALGMMKSCENQEETNQNNNEPHASSELKNKDEISGNPHKISLGSKAETDIVMAAKRKRVVVATYVKQLNAKNTYSIRRLKGLRRLNLTGCEGINDVALRYSMSFNELQELTLAKCNNISGDGVESILKACPAIEILNLSYCQSIKDKTVESISKNLKRLTHLYLKSCNQLTDQSLICVLENCKLIRQFDIENCEKILGDPGFRLVCHTAMKYNLGIYNRQEEDLYDTVVHFSESEMGNQLERLTRERDILFN